MHFVSVLVMLTSFDCNDWFVFIVLCIRTDYMLVYVDSLFHRLVSLVGFGWFVLSGSFWRGQVFLFYHTILLDNILNRKRTGQAQPPSPVRRKCRIYTAGLVLLICQGFGV